MSWFRLYTDIINDPKVQRLPAELFKAWINLLCLAKEHEGVLPHADDIAFALRLSVDDVVVILDELVKRQLLDHDDDEVQPHNWNARQYKSDVSTDRVRKYRETKVKRDGNVSVTPPETEYRDRTETEQREVEAASCDAPTPAPVLKPARQGKKTRLTAEFKPPAAWRDYAVERGYTEQEAAGMASVFKDHWLAKGEPHLDWDATWRNWVRRQLDFDAKQAQRATR